VARAARHSSISPADESAQKNRLVPLPAARLESQWTGPSLTTSQAPSPTEVQKEVTKPVLLQPPQPLAGPPLSRADDRATDVAGPKPVLGWLAPAAAAFAVLAVVAGAAFRDRPTVLGALPIAGAVATVYLLVRWFAARVRESLSDASAGRECLAAELATAREAKEEYRSLAYHDDLTGLPNRSLLHDRLALAITHSSRHESNLAVLFLDVDDFKGVNDSFGHACGDRVLVELAGRIRRTVRAEDTVARLGGDEFVVLLAHVTGAEDAARVAAKVLDAVRAPLPLDGHQVVSIGASIGVSVFPGNGVSPEDLVRSADEAMYRAKERRAAPTAGPMPSG
jgi:diguanylate cyclase (GGDEF)-like protein